MGGVGWGGEGWVGWEDLLLCSWDEDDFTSSTVSTTDQQPGVSHAHDDPPLFIVVIPFTFTLPICPVVSNGQLRWLLDVAFCAFRTHYVATIAIRTKTKWTQRAHGKPLPL